MTHLLKELSKVGLDCDQWKAKFIVLKELTEHHIKEEESDIFPEFYKILGNEQLDAIGELILIFKNIHMKKVK